MATSSRVDNEMKESRLRRKIIKSWANHRDWSLHGVKDVGTSGLDRLAREFDMDAEVNPGTPA